MSDDTRKLEGAEGSVRPPQPEDVIREAQVREARLRADALERAAGGVHAVGAEHVTLPVETVMAVAALLHVLAIRVANQGGEARVRPSPPPLEKDHDDDSCALGSPVTPPSAGSSRSQPKGSER